MAKRAGRSATTSSRSRLPAGPRLRRRAGDVVGSDVDLLERATPRSNRVDGLGHLLAARAPVSTLTGRASLRSGSTAGATAATSAPFPSSAPTAYSRVRRRGVIALTVHYTKAQFLTVAEVARALRVSNMTVYRLITGGQLPAVRVGKSYRLREEDVDRFLAQRFTEAG